MVRMRNWSQTGRARRVLSAAGVGAMLWATPAAARVPVGQWRFDEGSGAIAHHSSGAGLDGTLGSGPNSIGPSWVAGVSGTALHFDGDDYVALPDSTMLEPERITVAAWVRRAGSPGDYRYIVSKGSTACEMSSYGLYTGKQGSVAFYVSSASRYTFSPEPSVNTVWDGRWHRVVGTYGGSDVRLYIDGAQIGDGTPAPGRIDYGLSSKAPYIGTYRGGCDLPFSGDIDTVDIYGAALSDAEIAADAGLPATVVPPPLPGTGGGSIPASPAPSTPSPPRPAGQTVRAGCLWLKAQPGTLRARRRTRIVAAVRINGHPRAHVRLRLRGRRLSTSALTNRRGLASSRVRPAGGQRALTLRARSTATLDCAHTATIRIRIR